MISAGPSGLKTVKKSLHFFPRFASRLEITEDLLQEVAFIYEEVASAAAASLVILLSTFLTA